MICIHGLQRQEQSSLSHSENHRSPDSQLGAVANFEDLINFVLQVTLESVRQQNACPWLRMVA